MKQIILGIIMLFLAVLVIAAFAYTDHDYLVRQSKRLFGDTDASVTTTDVIDTAEPESNTNTPYYADAAARMAARGILPAGDAFDPDAALKRASMTQIFCLVLGLEEEAQGMKGKTDYVDVPENYWASGYINCATAHGLIGGVGDGFFGPEDVVLYEQGIKVALVCLGEEDSIHADPGDWASAYLAHAEKIGLTDTLTGKAGELLRYDDFAVLIDRVVQALDARAAETADK